MSEADPIPPTSSVTALRIPMIKKGEYDLWSMKMRQYIAITDHILWDIITNGDQATTDPASSSAPKTSLAANARRNNEKALNILLSAIPDRHLLSFHDAADARTLWSAIKARFGGNEASKKMQKNLLKQQFETFTIGSREELDSAYERFQNILIATMIRGQPGLDELEFDDHELDFDDLYNNLKVYEHELKGVSNLSSPNIAFLSTEVKDSTLKQSTADPANIPKGYTQAASSKVHTAPNYASHSDEIICSFFSQQASMPTTHDDEDLLQIDEDAMEEIDIRWQVAMITARIRKFMRKTGRPIDLKPKNGITFDKSKIEYSNSKALVATDNNEDIDWTKEFDAEPVTYAMMALTGVEQDDWSMEFDAEHVHFGQDGLGDFDWSNKDDDTPVSLALMATNSEVPYCSKCSKSYKLLLENYQKERDNFQRARTEILGYQMSLESLEVMLKTHEKNEYAWGDKYEQMEYDLKIRDLKLEEKQKELDQALKERDDFKVKLEKWSNASVLQNEVLNKQRYVSDKSCIGFGIESSNSMESDISSGDETLTDSAYENFKREKAYKAVPPPTGTIIPPRANVSFTGIDELAIRNKVVNQEKTRLVNQKLIEIKSPNSQNSVGQESRTKGLGNKGGTIKKKDLKAYAIIDSGCSGTQCSLQVKNVLSISMFKFVDEICKFCWVFFLAYKDETYDMLHDLIVGLENRLRHKVKTIRCDNGTEFKNQLMNEFCAKKGIKREYSIARDSQQMVLQKTRSSWVSLMASPKKATCWDILLAAKVSESTTGTMASEERTDAKKFHCPLKNKSYMAELLNLTTKISIPACLLVSLSSRRTQESLQALADERWLNRSRRKLYNSKPARAQLPEIEAIRLFLAFAIFLGLHFYQMDVKSAFLYGNITEDSVCQTASRFEDPDQYKQVKQSNGGIFLSQDKYVKDILNKFDFRTIKPASTPIEAHKSLGKDEEGEDVDVHLYRSMIGCLMYLTASRPDIMFVVCLCARFQVTPKVSHLHAVKRIFRYLKHQPKLGLWYPKDSPFHLEAFSDSDYAGDNHDRRSTSGGCQYLGRRLVSWQCKKQTIVGYSLQ
ncbi:uncharacterized mitochondrial protein-like protein [Tanacetum coccineum]